MYEIIGWVIALVVFVVLEAVTACVVSIWFAGGAACALIFAALSAPLWLQFAVFFVVSVLLLLLLRPLARRWTGVRPEATNADRVIGQEALVTETIDRLHSRGAVRIGGVEWSAKTDNDVIIPEGSLVRILRIEGVYVYVELIEALPDALSPEKTRAAFLGKTEK